MLPKCLLPLQAITLCLFTERLQPPPEEVGEPPEHAGGRGRGFRIA
jgi:hypothetical protein